MFVPKTNITTNHPWEHIDRQARTPSRGIRDSDPEEVDRFLLGRNAEDLEDFSPSRSMVDCSADRMRGETLGYRFKPSSLQVSPGLDTILDATTFHHKQRQTRGRRSILIDTSEKDPV